MFVHLLVETDLDTTVRDVETTFVFQWDVVLENTYSVDTPACRKFWINFHTNRRIWALLDAIDEHGVMLSYDNKEWNVSRVHEMDGINYAIQNHRSV